VEDLQPYIVPTLSKAKISHHLSYPIGAAAVSQALVSLAQLPDLKLHFYYCFDIWLRRGHYEFLRVEYLNNATPADEYPISRLFGRPPQYRWEIVVQPVPRALRHQIKEFILESALPQIASWLARRAELARRGSDILAFFYDEKKGELQARQLSQLEPLRSSSS
jgi:hypothetical protein